MDQTKFLNLNLWWDDFYWQGYYFDKIFSLIDSSEIQLHVDTEDEENIEPHELQVKAWKDLLSNQDKYFPQILNETYSYYSRMRPRYEKMGAIWVENMPPLTSPDQLKDMISLNIIKISWPDKNNSINIGFSFACSWEREHGLGLIFKNSEFKQIGDADILY